MNEREILFKGPMVRAILEGRKTQTRRLYKPSKGFPYQDGETTPNPNEGSTWMEYGPCPYGNVGDRLWVKETWCPSFAHDDKSQNGYCYRATHNGPDPLRWNPSIFMPRWASRITLEITAVRLENLQDISEDDAQEEGVERMLRVEDLYANWTGNNDKAVLNYRDGFRCIFEQINGEKVWEENPMVWAITFKEVKGE